MKFIRNFFFVLFIFYSGTNLSGQEDKLIIKNVSIVDVKSGKIYENRNVLIEGNRIKSINDGSMLSEEAMTINAKNKFLIPGLWDMHAHNIEIPQINQLFLAKGVTGLRDIGGYPGQREKLDSIRNSGMLLPRYLIGHTVDGKQFPYHIVVETPAEAVAVVDSLHQSDSDFIKAYSSLQPEVFEAIMQRANELNMPVAGHVPDLVHTSTASNFGMKSVEHVAYVLKDATPLAGELRQAHREMQELEGREDVQKAALKIIEKEIKTFDPTLGREIARVLVENNTAVTPTLITMYMHWHRPVVNFRKYPEMQYVPPHVRKSFDPATTDFTAKEWKTGQKMHSVNQELVQILNEEGVLLLAGTDAPLVPSGFSLHDELQLLVDSGLSPLEALQTATVNPAVFLGREKELGSVEEGYLADLVLLDANPLADISNAEEIYGVLVNGKYLDRNKLDQMLKKISNSFSE